MSSKPTGRPSGRPTKLTPELQAKLVELLSKGNFVSTACRASGIEPATFARWMDRGRKARRGMWREFFDAAQAAVSSAETKQVGKVVDCAVTDVKQARWWLTHGPARKRWADNVTQHKVELTGKDGGPIKVENARQALLDKLERLADQMIGDEKKPADAAPTEPKK